MEIGAQEVNTLPKSVSESLGYPKSARVLVIQGEDLGMAHSVDSATFDALEKGWITTANVLAPGPWFPEVVRWARNHPNADLGIQLDLNSEWKSFCWRPLSDPAKDSGLIDRFGYLPASNGFVAGHAKPEAVEAEVRAQIEMARNAGIPIWHVDDHMQVMRSTPALFRIYWKMGQEYNLPIMLPRQQVKQRGIPTASPGGFSFGGIDVNIASFPVDTVLEIEPGLAQRDWLDAYERTLQSLGPGVYLLSVHLGFNDEELKAMTWDHPNWGAQWRQNDYDVISSPTFQKFLKDQGFVLIGWKELKKVIPDAPARN